MTVRRANRFRSGQRLQDRRRRRTATTALSQHGTMAKLNNGWMRWLRAFLGYHVMVWTSLLVGCCSVSALADPPQLSFLYPAGGQRGASTRVTCHGSFTWPVHVWSPHAQVTVHEEEGQITLTLPHDWTGDRTWIRVYDDEGASDLVPFLVGNLPELTEQEPNNQASEPQSLAKYAAPPGDANVTINGVLQDNGDVDAFAFQLRQGQTVAAAVQANAAFGSPIDAILQIVSPDGTTLAESHDEVGLDPRLAYTAPEDGTYIARLFAFPANPNQSIRFHGGKDYVYRLKLTTGPYITHTVPMAAQWADADASPTSVEVRGWNIPTGTIVRPTRLPSIPSLGTSEVLPGAGLTQASIGVVHLPHWAGAARVLLDATPVLPATVETSKETPLDVAVPLQFAGMVASPGHRDYFRLSLKKNQSVRIAVDAVQLHSALVPRVHLRNPDGSIAVESAEGGAIDDVQLNYTASQDGDYLLEIHDRFGHGSDRHFYRCSLTTPRTDFRLSLDADRITLKSDRQSVEVTVHVHRDAGKGDPVGEVTIAAVELPPGVRSEPTTSKPDDDSAKKVTLSLVAEDAAAFSGPIRIQGQSAAGATVRWATTPEKFGVAWGHAWLTVQPAAAETAAED